MSLISKDLGEDDFDNSDRRERANQVTEFSVSLSIRLARRRYIVSIMLSPLLKTTSVMRQLWPAQT